MVFKGSAILGLNHTTRDRNMNWKVIIKSVTLYMIWLYHVPSLSWTAMIIQAMPLSSPYHILPVLIRSIHGSHPSSLPWNSHETTFYTASTFEAVNAIESEVRPSAFSPGYLRLFARHRGSLGRVHPWSNTTQGSCITSLFVAHGTAFPHTSAFKAVSAIGSGIRPPIFFPDHLRVFSGPGGCFGC